MALHLFLETLMTLNAITPSCVSIVVDNARTERSPKHSKSRKRPALDSSVHKGKSRWHATVLPSRPGTMIERSVSDSVLSRPKRATSPGRGDTRNASWDDNRFMEPGSTKTASPRCRTSRAQTPSLHTTTKISRFQTSAEHTRKRLSSISEARYNRALISSSSEKTRTMQRTKSLDSKLYNKSIIDLRMSQNKNFQKTETPRDASESRIKSDSLRQALGMIAPSASKKNSKLTMSVKPNSLRNSAARENKLRNADGPMTRVSDRKNTTLYNSRIELRMPQRTDETPRGNTAEAHIQSDSLRQVLGMSMTSSVTTQIST